MKINKIYIIAEAGVAHFGSLKKGKKLIDIASQANADAVKFQCYITDDLISRNYKRWYDRYKIKEVNLNFLKKLKEYSKKKKIDFLCTPHTESTLSWIKLLRTKYIKIGSGEIGNYRFLEKVINLKKHIIISTGMHTEKEMINLRNFFEKKKFNKVSFLRCVTLYPTKNKNINLKSFKKFKEIFKNYTVGYSDHTNHDMAILGSIVLGAKIVEKHISIDFKVKNAQDWKVSFDRHKFKKMVQKIRFLESILGSEKIFLSKDEKKSLIWATKSIYAKKEILKKTKFTLNNICSKRPRKGVLVKDFNLLINKLSGKKIKKGEPIKRNYIV